MIVSHEKGNSKLSEENIQDEIYFLEYEDFKGKMVDVYKNERFSDVVSELGLTGKYLCNRKFVFIEIPN